MRGYDIPLVAGLEHPNRGESRVSRFVVDSSEYNFRTTNLRHVS